MGEARSAAPKLLILQAFSGIPGAWRSAGRGARFRLVPLCPCRSFVGIGNEPQLFGVGEVKTDPREPRSVHNARYARRTQTSKHNGFAVAKPCRGGRGAEAALSYSGDPWPGVEKVEPIRTARTLGQSACFSQS